jgi:hypothetical protein
MRVQHSKRGYFLGTLFLFVIVFLLGRNSF